MPDDMDEFREFQAWKSEKNKVQTTQLTAKRWKAGIGLGLVVAIVAGFFSSLNLTIAMIFVVAGALTALLCGVMAWWHHG